MADRGVGEAEIAAAGRYFFANPDLDPESCVMDSALFARTLGPFWIEEFGQELHSVTSGLLFNRQNPVVDAERRKPPTGGKKAKEPSAALPFVTPGHAIRIVPTDGQEGFSDVILNTRADRIVVSMPHTVRLKPGQAVEVHLDIGLALCGLVGRVVEISQDPPPACQIGKFVEGWVIRRRQAIRLKMTRPIRFGCMPVSETPQVQSLTEINSRLAPTFAGELQDLSYGGCHITTAEDHDFRKGDLVRYSIELVADSPPASLYGAVVHTVRRHGGAGVGLHIQFLVLDNGTQEVLARALRQWIVNAG